MSFSKLIRNIKKKPCVTNRVCWECPFKKNIPEWFKKLPNHIGSGLTNGTVKRCPPFLDALTAGWIIPLCADVHIVSNDKGNDVKFRSNFYKPMIAGHNHKQFYGETTDHPLFPSPLLKFLNYWIVKPPKGYSLLFTEPFNNPDPRFSCFTGIVECDKYGDYVHFPFIFKEKNFDGVLKAGTPLVQVIPIKRDMLDRFEVRQFTEREEENCKMEGRRNSAQESWYRNFIWRNDKKKKKCLKYLLIREQMRK